MKDQKRATDETPGFPIMSSSPGIGSRKTIFLGGEDSRGGTINQPRKYKPREVTHLYEIEGQLTVGKLMEVLAANFELGATIYNVSYNNDHGLRVYARTVSEDDDE